MKYIHIVITEVTCEGVQATSLVYNECLELEDSALIDYPNNIDEHEIAEIINPNIGEFKMTFASIGGGGIKRPKK